MPRIDLDFARHFADSWIEAWNRHDLDAILEHYTEDFEFSSPVIIDVVGERSGTLRGKSAVRAYWEKALSRVPGLRFELQDVLTGVDAITLYYRGHRGTSAESFHFDPTGKVDRAFACYTVDD